MSVTVADLRVKFSADTAGAVRGIDTVQHKIGEVGGSMRRIGEFAFGGLLQKGIEGGIRAIAGLGSAMFGTAMEAADLNSGISGIVALAGGGAAEVEQLKTLISDLGMDPNLKVSSVEAAGAIQELIANGLTLPDVMNGAAESTVLLANSTGAQFTTAAKVATDTMSIFGIQAEDMMTAVNGITGVVNASKFGINDYALALAQGGGTAAAVGVSFEDFNTTITALSNKGFSSGSDAGTSFRAMLQRLIPQGDDAAAMMKKLGLITEDGGLVFYDANGQMKDMAEIVGYLNRAFSGLSDVEKNAALDTIFLADAGRSAAALAGYTEEEYRKLQATIGNTNAMESARTRMDNLKGDMEIFSGVLESVRLKIGDKFQPALRTLYKSATSLLSNLSPMLIGAAEGLASYLSGVADSLTTTITDMTTKATEAFTQAGGGVQGLLAGLGAATGATVTIDAEAGITSVDWGVFTYTYDADSSISTVEWGDFTGTYNAAAAIATINWRPEGLNTDVGVVYDAEAGIKKVTWVEDGGEGFHWVYDASAQITTVGWGDAVLFSHKYIAQAEITEVAWGTYQHFYSASADVTSVLWGLYYGHYEADVRVTDVAWGVYTHTYESGSTITSVLWGAYTGVYKASAQISESDVLWGAYTHTYNGIVDIGETNILWGAYTHTYDVQAQVGEKGVLWGLFTWTYDAQANITDFAVAGSVTPLLDVVARISSWVSGENDTPEWLQNLSLKVLAEAPLWLSRLKIDTTEPGWLPLLMIQLPDLSQLEFSWPDLPDWTWPDMPEFSWPDLPDWAWPDLPEFSWPSLPKWNWPTIPTPAWLNTLLNWSPSLPSWLGGSTPGSNADGTSSWKGGWTWVGEKGPELVSLPRGSRIYNNADSLALAGAGGGNTTVYVTVNATVNNDLDVQRLAYRVADVIRRRR